MRPSAVLLLSVLLLGALACSSDQTRSMEQARDVQNSPDLPNDSADLPMEDAAEMAQDIAEDLPPQEDQGPALDPSCGPEPRALPEGLTVLAWDDDQGVGVIPGQGRSLLGMPFDALRFYEATGFELEHPARVHAVSVQFGVLPEDPNQPVELGLYGDFGYNGFDFWRFDPLWTGRRCGGQLQVGQWYTFILEEPLEVAHPGLLYAAHLYEGADSGALLFDGSLPQGCTQEACCADFGQCHSAWNFPDLQQFQANGQNQYAWNGLSTSFQFDYMLRLHVEYTEQLQRPEELFTTENSAIPADRVAWGDYDNDGDDDLLTTGPGLYRNDGGRFTDVTAQSQVRDGEARGAGIWGDYDNDGCLDLFLFEPSAARPDNLMRNNCDGTFSNVTAQSGLVDVHPELRCNEQEHMPSHAAAWWDIDADGFLDLFVANYECGNQNYPDQIWRNQGDGTFASLGTEQGFLPDSFRAATRGAAPIDADQDGDVDLFVNTYRLGRNVYYQNQGQGQVSEQGEALHLEGERSTVGFTRYWGHSIGAAWGDLDEDGRFDLVVANLAHPRFYDFSDKTQVLLQQPDGGFMDIQGDWSQPRGDAGLRYQETHSSPALGDFDLDGHLDLVISAVYDGRPTDFYWGRGDGTFVLDSYRSGLRVRNGWGLAVSDFDLDGDLDLASRGALQVNQRQHGGGWLQVRAVGDAGSNRAALGATVRVTSGDQLWLRHVSGGNGQGCQDSLYLHFGLGQAQSVDRIEVHFPGDAQPTVFEGPFDPNQRLWLYQSGRVERGWRADP